MPHPHEQKLHEVVNSLTSESFKSFVAARIAGTSRSPPSASPAPPPRVSLNRSLRLIVDLGVPLSSPGSRRGSGSEYPAIHPWVCSVRLRTSGVSVTASRPEPQSICHEGHDCTKLRFHIRVIIIPGDSRPSSKLFCWDARRIDFSCSEYSETPRVRRYEKIGRLLECASLLPRPRIRKSSPGARLSFHVRL